MIGASIKTAQSSILCKIDKRLELFCDWMEISHWSNWHYQWYSPSSPHTHILMGKFPGALSASLCSSSWLINEEFRFQLISCWFPTENNWVKTPPRQTLKNSLRFERPYFLHKRDCYYLDSRAFPLFSFKRFWQVVKSLLSQLTTRHGSNLGDIQLFSTGGISELAAILVGDMIWTADGILLSQILQVTRGILAGTLTILISD